eukprot:GHVT01067277.1.p1 GENE.GHVT01067277.1~~GHVT01067277.1.p1  ORF type:complete len:454 (+),score=106.28 GHVT01067277.1:361-1722(+)
MAVAVRCATAAGWSAGSPTKSWGAFRGFAALPPAGRPSSLRGNVWLWGRPAAVPPLARLMGNDPGVGLQALATPTRVPLLQNVAVDEISVGATHAAVIADGELLTFGSNKFGQLGRQTDSPESAARPGVVSLPAGLRVRSVSCGPFHTAIVAADGELLTCGWGGSLWSGAGGLGLGTLAQRHTPEVVEALEERVTRVACGHQHTIVLTERGRVYSCGRGEFGRLGRGYGGDQLSPLAVDLEGLLAQRRGGAAGEGVGPATARGGADGGVRAVACGRSHSAALTEDGCVWAWGRNDCGQLGLEDSLGDVYSDAKYPRPLTALEREGVKVAAIACGDDHMLALAQNGVIYFWGARLWLQPRALTLPPQYRNTSIKGKVTKLFAGGAGSQYFNFALTDDGDLHTWGKPRSQALARPIDRGDEMAPCRVDREKLFGNEKFVDAACGRWAAMAVTVAG